MPLSFEERERKRAQKAEFCKLRQAGYKITDACRMVGVSRQSGSSWERERVAARRTVIDKAVQDGLVINEHTRDDLTGKTKKHYVDPATADIAVMGIPEYEDLCPEAKRALKDFAYFRRRYLGRISTPWQEDAAYKVVELLETPHKEYVVINVAPGSGKSTLFTHDIPLWLSCRDRSIRALIGSRTGRQAKWYTGRLRRSFERNIVLEAEEGDRKLGLAVDAESTLIADFGHFKPITFPGAGKDPWRIEEFVLAQPGNVAIEDKEASFTAFGMDSGFLGGRFKLVIWDDLVDKTNTRTEEARANLINWYETEAETRLEPGGLLVLQGQRMATNDLFRHALDLTAGDPDEGEPIRQKYKHVVYKAHDEERCTGDHKTTDAPWHPDGTGGCLIDPRRLSWRDLKPIIANREDRFRILYQQEDVDPASVLVQRVWIDGGRGEDGVEYLGCWDDQRRLGQLPRGIDPSECVSVCTADPSPTKNWAIQWWLYHPGSEQRFLINFYRGKLEAPELLDWLIFERRYVGLMDEWQAQSVALGAPIQYWIVEVNAAQRFLLQYEHVKKWQIKVGVNIVPHTTGIKKMDENLGVPMVQQHWRTGRYRLPGLSKIQLLPFYKEVTSWELGTGKSAGTDDCVLANWFLEVHLPVLEMPNLEAPQMAVPSWLGTPAFVRA